MPGPKVQHGNEDQQQAVLKRAADADPKHGEKWTQVTKAPENTTVGGYRLTTEQAVKKVCYPPPTTLALIKTGY